MEDLQTKQKSLKLTVPVIKITDAKTTELENILSKKCEPKLCDFSTQQHIENYKQTFTVYKDFGSVGNFSSSYVNTWDKAIYAYNNTKQKYCENSEFLPIYVACVTEALKQCDKDKITELIRIINLYRKKFSKNYRTTVINGQIKIQKPFIDGDFEKAKFENFTNNSDTVIFEKDLYYNNNIKYKHKTTGINIGDVIKQSELGEKTIKYVFSTPNNLIETLETAENNISYMKKLIDSNILAKTITGVDQIIDLNKNKKNHAIIRHFDPSYISFVEFNNKQYKDNIIYAIDSEKLQEIIDNLDLVTKLNKSKFTTKYNWQTIQKKDSQFFGDCYTSYSVNENKYNEEDYANSNNILYLPYYNYEDSQCFSMNTSSIPGKIDYLNLSTRILRDLAVTLKIRKNAFFTAKAQLKESRDNKVKLVFKKIKGLLKNNCNKSISMFENALNITEKMSDSSGVLLIDQIANARLDYILSLSNLEFSDWYNNVMKKISYEKQIVQVILKNVNKEIQNYESLKIRKYKEKIKSCFKKTHLQIIYEQQCKYRDILTGNLQVIENALNMFEKVHDIRKLEYTLLRIQNFYSNLKLKKSNDIAKHKMLYKTSKLIKNYKDNIITTTNNVIDNEYESGKYGKYKSFSKEYATKNIIRKSINNTITLDGCDTLENILGPQYYVRNGYLSYYEKGNLKSVCYNNMQKTLNIFVNGNDKNISVPSNIIQNTIDTTASYGDGYCEFQFYEPELSCKIANSLRNNENIHIAGKNYYTSVAQYLFYKTLSLIKHNKINYTGKIIIELDAPIGVSNNIAKLTEKLLSNICLKNKPILYIFYGIGDKSILSGNILGIDYANNYIDYRSKIFLNKLYVTPLEAHCGYIMPKILCNQVSTDSYNMVVQDIYNFTKLKNILFNNYYTKTNEKIPNINSVYNIFELFDIKEKFQPYKTHKDLTKSEKFLTTENFSLLPQQIQKIIIQDFNTYNSYEKTNATQKALQVCNEYNKAFGTYNKQTSDYNINNLYPFSQKSLFYQQQLQTTNC